MARSEASKLAQKRYRETHKDKVRELVKKHSRTFYALHKDEINAKRREKYRLKKEAEVLTSKRTPTCMTHDQPGIHE